MRSFSYSSEFSEDETIIELINSKFNLNLDKSLFSFIVPDGTDVIMMDE